MRLEDGEWLRQMQDAAYHAVSFAAGRTTTGFGLVLYLPAFAAGAL